MKQWKTLSASLAITVTVLFVFQNCADPLEFGAEDSLTSNGDTLPFAFEEKMDTLSYMSCSNIDVASFQPRAIYSFRIGAYKDGNGLRLSEEFFNATKGLADSARAEALYNSEINRNASLQLSVRQTEVYQDILINEDGKVSEGFDYANFLAPLDTSGIANRLSITKDGDYVSYFAGTPGVGTRFLEQSIRFIGDENRALQVRQHLMGSAGVERESKLTLTYTVGDDQQYQARAAVEGAADKVYGTGYRVEFRTPTGFVGATPRALRYVEEYDLRTGRQKPEAVWDCGGDANTYTIVRASDVVGAAPNANQKICSTVVDGELSVGTLTDVELKRLAVIRRVLRPEDWWVDPRNMCVVPKTNSANCYGEANGAVTVNYTTACTGATCPHIVSVCERVD